ncbi:MAG: hypothetical protein U1D30_26710 [Planctomycetota bacterium]
MSGESERSSRLEEHPDVIEMPAPTAAPMVVAFGVTLLAAGIVTNPTFSLVGFVIFLAGLVQWFGSLLRGEGVIFEELAPIGERAPRIEPAARGVQTLRPGMHGHRMRIPEKLHPYSAGLRGGIAGGLAMAAVALAYGIASGHGIWYPVNMLAAVVIPGFSLESLPEMDKFQPDGLAMGLAIHVCLSLMVGLFYGMILPMLPSQPILWGGIVAPALWTGSLHGAMGVLNPVMSSLVDWPWFIASQVIFGLVTGAVVVRSEKVYADGAPLGSGSSEENP